MWKCWIDILATFVEYFLWWLYDIFTKVCELDLIFNFHKAYFILDEVFLNGELQETSKKAILRVISAQDTLMDNAHEHSFST